MQTNQNMGCESIHHQWTFYKEDIDHISHHGYFMGYAATIVVIIYWNPGRNIIIHRAYYVWFDEYNSRLSIEYKNTPGSVLIQQYPESIIHDSDLLNLITCELDLKSTLFSDTPIITYITDLPPSGKKSIFNLLMMNIYING